MILFYFLFLLPIHVYSGDDFWPSYRSSVMEGDKPILRGSGPEPGVVVNDENAVSDNARSKINQRYLNPDHDPEMIRNYGLFLGWLMNTYGYAISDSRRQGKEYLDAEDSLKIHSDKHPRSTARREYYYHNYDDTNTRQRDDKYSDSNLNVLRVEVMRKKQKNKPKPPIKKKRFTAHVKMTPTFMKNYNPDEVLLQFGEYKIKESLERKKQRLKDIKTSRHTIVP